MMPKKNSKTGIFKQGNFKVSSRADIPWFERVDEIDRGSIDKLAREYEDAKPNGSVLRGDERTENKDASRRGNSDLTGDTASAPKQQQAQESPQQTERIYSSS